MAVPVRAAGLVIYRVCPEIQYLLMQASYANHHWSPPKGHVDEGELEFVTALRETKEEAGFSEKDLKILSGFEKTLQYYVKGKPKTVTYWLAQLINNDASVQLSSEHQAYKWLNLNEACELSGYKDMAELLQECHDFIVKSFA